MGLEKFGALTPSKTLFILCDIQEAFRKVFQHFLPAVENTKKLICAGKVFNIPLLVTEQYPKGLGHTAEELDVSHALAVIEKTKFSVAVPELVDKMKSCVPDANSIILFGFEAHVCVEQSVMDLLALGYNVHVVADCTMSRSLEDRAMALHRFRQIGAFVTTSENVIFKLLKDKDAKEFKEIRNLVKEPSQDTGLAKL